jgi:hypothetical protein
MRAILHRSTGSPQKKETVVSAPAPCTLAKAQDYWLHSGDRDLWGNRIFFVLDHVERKLAYHNKWTGNDEYEEIAHYNECTAEQADARRAEERAKQDARSAAEMNILAAHSAHVKTVAANQYRTESTQTAVPPPPFRIVNIIAPPMPLVATPAPPTEVREDGIPVPIPPKKRMLRIP